MDNSAEFTSNNLDGCDVAYPTRQNIKQTMKTAPETIPNASGLFSWFVQLFSFIRVYVHVRYTIQVPVNWRQIFMWDKNNNPIGDYLFDYNFTIQKFEMNSLINNNHRFFYYITMWSSYNESWRLSKETYTGLSAKSVPLLPKSLPQIPFRSVYSWGLMCGFECMNKRSKESI